MTCTLEDIRECLKLIKPKELSIPASLLIPRDPNTKINAGPVLGLVTTVELRTSLYDHINDALAYYNLLYILSKLVINSKYDLTYAVAFEKYKFNGWASERYHRLLDPEMYPLIYNRNLKPVDPLVSSNGIQNIPEYKNAFDRCMALFNKCKFKLDDINILMKEIANNIDVSADLYSQTFSVSNTTIRGRANRNLFLGTARKSSKHSKKLKRKTMKNKTK